MKLEKEIYFKDAIIIDSKTLKELEDSMSKYLGNFAYEVVTIDGTEIIFDTLQELSDFDNCDNYRIDKLRIYFCKDSRKSFSERFEFNPDRFSLVGIKSCILKYSIENLEDDACIRDKFYTTLNKYTASYSWFVKCKYIGKIVILSVMIFFVCTLVQKYLNFMIALNSNFNLFIAILIIGILMGLNKLANKVTLFLFPTVAFSIGIEEKNIEKAKEFRKNFFWVVIVGLAISIIASIIL